MHGVRARTLGYLTAAAVLVAACGGGASPTGTPVAGGGGTALPGATGQGGGAGISSINACSLLTKDEIKQALGADVKDGVPGSTDTQVSCTWDQAVDGQGPSVGVTVSVYDDVIWQTFSKAQGATPVSGLGEAAFSGYPHDGDISIKQGGYQIDIGIVDFRADQSRVHPSDTTFANLVLGRL